MSNTPSPLIQTITPERWAGWSMDFIGAGYIGLLVKNGQLMRRLEPGRHFSFALPWLEQCQIVLVDGKIRSLEVVSQGDFLSRDQFLVNVSLSIMYQVVDPKRIALELSDPIAALISAVKDSLGVVINLMRLDQLTQLGRVQIREHLLNHPDTFYTLGFNLEDVRVSDISFPQTRGVIRQVEGMSARAEAEHEAALKVQIANAERNAPVQQINIAANPSGHPHPFLPDVPHETKVLMPGGASAPVRLPAAPDRSPLPPTMLAANAGNQAIARLVNQSSGAIAILSANLFTIGREPNSTLVSEDALCSRNHARIEKVIKAEGASCYQIIDVGSSNGTFLNNQRLIPHQPVPLNPGSLIKIGSDEWIFQI